METAHGPSIENKRLMQRICEELAKGNGKPFVESLVDDFVWTLIGTTAWSGTYRGKRDVVDQLLKPLFAQFDGPYTNTAQRFIAEGDLVVVECRGLATTRLGKRYDNTYCWVCRIADGKLRELTEYMDTQLVAEALDAPSDVRGP
ncbi:nuclear transport factor 2 family protein [Piscinibacter sp.]|uniref:nuclear transport factor 2 family protein n=1 Tax=Piscinibacter sp. TaxID=1903157 RepID=UPI002B87863C|nr:nuclear transport factor 2 family protein [Albitalea sp.]HUG21245.1 nuclear transport factor 2 family protein [Albitalea sp.]